MSNRTLPLLIALATALLIISGCLSLNRKAPEKNFYSLGAETEISGTIAEKLIPLGVKEFEITPMYTTNSFIYRMGEFRFKTDYYNEFITTPQKMITEAVKQALFNTRGFYPSSLEDPSLYRLSGKVVRLYGDFRTPDHPLAVMEILINLDPTDKPDLKDSVSRIFSRKLPIKDQNPETLVMGWNILLGQILKDFTDQLPNF